MMFHKIRYGFLYRSAIYNYRSYSASSLTSDKRNVSDYKSQQKCLLNKSKTLCSLVTRRNLSVEAIVKWQEQTYTSISNSTMVNFMQDGLLYFHDITGFTWSVSIIATTLLLRGFMTLPLSIYQNKILAKLEIVGLELNDMVNELKKETAMAKKMYNLTDKKAMILFKISLKKQWRLLIERDNCHPLKTTLVIWLQIPIWVCMSFALRNLVNMNPPSPSAVITLMELEGGGFGWIPNLTECDHSLILPIAFGLTNLAIVEVQRMSKLRAPSKTYNIFTNIFRVFSIVMIPIAASVPSCMCLYWTTSSAFGLVQNLALLSPHLRRKLKIPEAPSELEDPYGHIRKEINKTPIIASIYTSGRDEQNFSKPNSFMPERWDKSKRQTEGIVNHIPSASLPFAIGARSCIGKKIAITQLTEVISEIVKNFDFKCTNKEDIGCITSQILVPDKAIELLFTSRVI